MARTVRRRGFGRIFDPARRVWAKSGPARLGGFAIAAVGATLLSALLSYRAADPSFDVDSGARAANWLGVAGANAADVAMQTLGLAAWAAAIVLVVEGLYQLFNPRLTRLTPFRMAIRALAVIAGLIAISGALAAPA